MLRLTIRQVIWLVIAASVLGGGGITIAAYFTAKWLDAQPSPPAVSPTVNSDPLPDAEPPQQLDADERNNITVYERVSPGVVNINTTSFVEDFFFGAYPQQGSGSGSIIDAKGHILTNYHVIEGASRLDVTLSDNTSYPATVVGADPDNDLAIIRIQAPADRLRVVPLGSSRNLRVGQKVLAIGNPFGLNQTLTSGIISALGRPLRSENGRTIENVIQTDASINPGNSGGPLLNSAGEMIGINTAIYSPRGGSVGIGFAVPVEVAKQIIPDLLEYGRVRRPWLGITNTYQLNARLAQRLNLPVSEGLILTGIAPRGPAAQAGLYASDRVVQRGAQIVVGDVIVKVGEVSIKSNDDLYRSLRDKKIGDSVPVTVIRAGQSLTVNITLQERPS
ncbi:MAG: trypsin-like peptidase domain-containing protein [Chloracidobacterium sp.]|uniref:Trypsin-like peptidase domain-containing protein n=1 Tax=Chloracidobacterium validum TaxID=2821543 RepID=A0ABX8BAI9_9BACT|nr:trypsin-like peptidase domain-containing protein [Chloracidobacterium validum]QUW02684.1 trypsin-like peptidase domain-containing protein [Chloracidobacterium validum]